MIGIVVAMQSEARIFGIRSIRPFEPVELAGGARLVLCGMGATAAACGADQLLRSGVAGLASFGIAGALSPQLRSGDLLCPDRVVDGNRAVFGVDAAWRAALLARLKDSVDGSLFSSARPLTDAGAKSSAAHDTGAIAVDMESAAIAAACHGLPFIVLRAVADEANASLPEAVMGAVDNYGRPRPAALLRALVRHPGAVRSLPALGRAFGAARSSLAQALRLTSANLAWPGAA